MQTTFFIGNFVSITYSNTITYSFSCKVASFSFATDFSSLRNFFWIESRNVCHQGTINHFFVPSIRQEKASSLCFLFYLKTVSIYEVQISSISHSRQTGFIVTFQFLLKVCLRHKSLSFIIFKFMIIFCTHFLYSFFKAVEDEVSKTI